MSSTKHSVFRTVCERVLCNVRCSPTHCCRTWESEEQWGRSEPGCSSVQEGNSLGLLGASALLSFMAHKNWCDEGSFSFSQCSFNLSCWLLWKLYHILSKSSKSGTVLQQLLQSNILVFLVLPQCIFSHCYLWIVLYFPPFSSRGCCNCMVLHNCTRISRFKGNCLLMLSVLLQIIS